MRKGARVPLEDEIPDDNGENQAIAELLTTFGGISRNMKIIKRPIILLILVSCALCGGSQMVCGLKYFIF